MTDQVAELEASLLAQAETQAREMLAHAKQRGRHILAEGRGQLLEREAVERATAESAGERVFRQDVQAHALSLSRELQQLRWDLVQAVLQDAWARLDALASDDQAYLRLLRGLLAHAAALIDTGELVVEVNARDRERLEPLWEDFRRAVPGRPVSLGATPIEARGGLMVHDSDNRVRVDERFEARVDRLRDRLHQTILERLLPA